MKDQCNFFIKKIKVKYLIYNTNRNSTNTITMFFQKKNTESLQVKELRIMFVSESNNSRKSNVNPTPETNITLCGDNHPVCFSSFKSGS